LTFSYPTDKQTLILTNLIFETFVFVEAGNSRMYEE